MNVEGCRTLKNEDTDLFSLYGIFLGYLRSHEGNKIGLIVLNAIPFSHPNFHQLQTSHILLSRSVCIPTLCCSHSEIEIVMLQNFGVSLSKVSYKFSKWRSEDDIFIFEKPWRQITKPGDDKLSEWNCVHTDRQVWEATYYKLRINIGIVEHYSWRVSWPYVQQIIRWHITVKPRLYILTFWLIIFTSWYIVCQYDNVL